MLYFGYSKELYAEGLISNLWPSWGAAENMGEENLLTGSQVTGKKGTIE